MPMRTVLLALTVLLTIWLSATGTELFAFGMWSIGALLLSAIVALLWPQSLRKSGKPGRYAKPTIYLCAALYVSALITQWPLRLTFALSQSSLEQLSDSIRAGHRFEGPQRVGFFLIQKADFNKYPGTVCLWTSVQANGNTGFVNSPPNVLRDPWSEIKLSERWRLLSED